MIINAEKAGQIIKDVEQRERQAEKEALQREGEWKNTPMEKRYSSGAKNHILRRALAAIEKIIVLAIKKAAKKKENSCIIYLFGIPKYHGYEEGSEFNEYLFGKYSEKEIKKLTAYYEHFRYNQGCCNYEWNFKHYACLEDWMKETFALLIWETLEYYGYHTYLEYDESADPSVSGYWSFDKYALTITW